jgi:hypothetical protein
VSLVKFVDHFLAVNSSTRPIGLGKKIPLAAGTGKGNGCTKFPQKGNAACPLCPCVFVVREFIHA